MVVTEQLEKAMPAHREPILSETHLRCGRCGEKWSQKLINNAPIGVIVAHWRSLRCPNCGAPWKQLYFRTDEDEQKRRDVTKFVEGLPE